MPEELEKIGIAVAVGLIIFIWLLPTELFVRVLLTGVLLLIVLLAVLHLERIIRREVLWRRQ